MDKHHLQSHLAKAKGLGASKEGTSHFFHQRVTALLLIPLSIWFCLNLAFLPQMSYQAVHSWIQQPFHSILLLLIIGSSFYHLQMGLQVIIEDYIATYATKLIAIIVMNLSCLLLAISAIYAILKISLG